MGMKRLVCLALIVILCAAPVTVFAAGRVPYRNFNYGFWGDFVPSPAAYVPVMSIGGPSLNPPVEPFRNPEHMFVADNGDIYVADTGNDRLVVFDRDLNLVKIIDSFIRDGHEDGFNRPHGVFVTHDFYIYIADTENHRVVVLNKYGEYVMTFDEPEHETLEDQFIFAPLRVCVDRAGQVYVIVRNVFEGIMNFNPDGTFVGYFGTVAVRHTIFDRIWRWLSTEAQRARQQLFIPVEFASMDIDEYGFIFTTNIAPGTQEARVKRLNTGGQNVLRNFTDHPIVGDLTFFPFGRLGGPAVFVDIVARGNGMYSVLDSTRGRLFTYDSEGNLLYVIGGTGNVMGMGHFPVAVEVLDDSILILDRQRGEIVYFRPTEYGRLINEAIALRYSGDEARAVEVWRQVLTLNENFTLAYAGIGKALLAAGENEQALYYLRKGMALDYYGIAFHRLRNTILQENLSMILTILMTGVVVIVGLRSYKKFRKQVAV